MRLDISEIEATSATQVRVRLDPDVIDDYAEAIRNGAPFPPVIVFAENGSSRYILADGFHRIAAAKKIGREQIGAKVIEGGLHEALHFALSANAEHGLQRSPSDKRHAVELALKDPQYDDWSLRDIADLCRVSHTLVRNVKEDQNRKQAEKEKPEKKAKKGEKPKVTNGEGRERPTLPPEDQGAVDRRHLRKAMKIIRSFPYPGSEAADKMPLQDEDIRELRLCWVWIKEAVGDSSEGLPGE